MATTTEERMALLELIEKRGDADLVRELLAYAAERLMAVEVDGLCGAVHGERSSARTNPRNGYRERARDTRAGRTELEIPKLREGSYFPATLEPRRTAEKALPAVIQEAGACPRAGEPDPGVHGVPTRAADDLVRAMGLAGASKSGVSRVRREIDERANAFLARPVAGEWPYLRIDATYVRVRENGRAVGTAVTIATAVNTDGRREVPGVATGPSEAEPFWTDFLRPLADRGLRGVELVVADDHEGLRAAAAKVLHATPRRRRVPLAGLMTGVPPGPDRSLCDRWMRDLLGRVPASRRGMVAARLRTISAQGTREAAHEQWRKVADSLRERFAKPAGLMEGAEHDVPAHRSSPEGHWAQLASANPLERLNSLPLTRSGGEIERRTDVVGIFPNAGRDPAGRRDPAGAERRVGGGPPLPEPGNHAAQRRY